MKIHEAEFLWAQKYRPRTVADVILPKAVKAKVLEEVKGGRVSNLLLDGKPGCGKTTLALAIAEDLGADVLQLNGSSGGRGIDVIRHEVASFCSSLSLEATHKIVFIDEADHLTPDAQAALRGTIEQYSAHTSFIFTTNAKYRLTEAVRSRFTEIDFKIPADEEQALKTEMLKRLRDILNNEGVEVTGERMKVLAGLVNMLFPHNRKILNTLQQMVRNDDFDASALTTMTSAQFDDLIEAIKGRKWKAMREWVAVNADVAPDAIIQYFWKNAEDQFGIEKMPQLIIHLDDYQKNIPLVRNPIISTVALFTKMMSV